MKDDPTTLGGRTHVRCRSALWHKATLVHIDKGGALYDGLATDCGRHWRRFECDRRADVDRREVCRRCGGAME